AITDDGTLALNRPDDFTIAGSVTGAGSLLKSASSAVTFPSSVSLNGPVTISGGSLKFGGGGNLAGAISGPGGMAVTGGTMQFSGADPNTFTGDVTVSAGVLQLSKAPGVNGVAGNITISGTGQLQTFQPEQIPDTATIFFNSD